MTNQDNTQTVLIQAKDLNQEWKHSDVYHFIRALGCQGYAQKVTPQKDKGRFAITLKEQIRNSAVIYACNEDPETITTAVSSFTNAVHRHFTAECCMGC